MKTIELEELRTIQMGILDVVHDFCIKNGIRYSLACGSMLGAVRHKGYIPWDDDIDIYVPRSDYERLVRIFPEEVGGVKLVSLEREPLWDRAFAKAYDCRTVLSQHRKSAMTIGVNVDVFPIDSVPDSDKEWLRYNRLRRTLIKVHMSKYSRIRKENPLLKNVDLVIRKAILLPFSSRRLACRVSRFAQRYNGKEGCGRSFECVLGMKQKRPFPSSLMDDLVSVPFEDRRYMAMRDSDAYLSNGFGDYMQLPPKEQQVLPHNITAWWKEEKI